MPPVEVRPTISVATSSAFDDNQYLSVKIPNAIAVYSELKVMEEIVKLTAERYVQENYAALMAKIDPVAVANLAIAKAAGAVMDMFVPKKEERR